METGHDGARPYRSQKLSTTSVEGIRWRHAPTSATKCNEVVSEGQWDTGTWHWGKKTPLPSSSSRKIGLSLFPVLNFEWCFLHGQHHCWNSKQNAELRSTLGMSHPVASPGPCEKTVGHVIFTKRKHKKMAATKKTDLVAKSRNSHQKWSSWKMGIFPTLTQLI